MTLLSVKEKPRSDTIVETSRIRPGVYVGRTLLPLTHRDIKVHVANTTNKPQTVDKGSCLGHPAAVTVLESDEIDRSNTKLNDTVPSTDLNELIDPVIKNLPEEISAEQRDKVIDLLTEYDGIFSRGLLDMGRTNLIEHTIDTGQHRPIRQSLRRHPWAHLEEIDRQVAELQEADLIEPAASPWASNVVLVRKKDGTHRLCVDYRKLNEATYKDSYPLPRIDTCLESMNGVVWFSTLDLRSGYHNIPISEPDRDKTAFITRRGCFRYKVMPFVPRQFSNDSWI